MDEEKSYKKKSFGKEVGDKEGRKLHAQHEKKSVWSGLGLFGMIGWSVVVPALLGAAFGVWLDKRYKQSFSWTLSLLIAGLMLGCFIAWNWVQKEDKEINKKKGDEND
ncbi:MAG: AtpZ/AtpI family protein [Ginsengibacter sp.]